MYRELFKNFPNILSNFFVKIFSHIFLKIFSHIEQKILKKSLGKKN